MVGRDLARRLRERSRTRGDVPAGWQRWAEDILDPVVSWQRILSSALRRGVADMAGRVDFSYRRPSRCRWAPGAGRVAWPGRLRGILERGMQFLAIDLASVASLTTAAGTLVLAVATFGAIRSSNRSARIAEAALQEQRRPLLAPSRLDDPMQKIMFMDGHWVRAEGQRAVAEHIDGTVFLAMSLRNVGSGIAVCQGWVAWSGASSTLEHPTHAPVDEFRLQSRDLYIPAGDIGMWQGALRHPDDDVRVSIAEAIDRGESLTIELLYSDQVGRQRTISRFGLYPAGGTWLLSTTRHWYLDWDGPRPEGVAQAAADTIARERDLADQRRLAVEGAREGVEGLGLDDLDARVAAAGARMPAGGEPDLAG